MALLIPMPLREPDCFPASGAPVACDAQILEGSQVLAAPPTSLLSIGPELIYSCLLPRAMDAILHKRFSLKKIQRAKLLSEQRRPGPYALDSCAALRRVNGWSLLPVAPRTAEARTPGMRGIRFGNLPPMLGPFLSEVTRTLGVSLTFTCEERRREGAVRTPGCQALGDRGWAPLAPHPHWT